MRSHPAEYELVTPQSLHAALLVLADDPGRWTPVAGGTEIMVQFGAGRLNAHYLVNIWGLSELRQITETAETLIIGGGCTFSQLRVHPTLAKHFPLLAQAASWTGSIANQNRATIAGNIVNASPAADSPPALLAYDAELELISAHGTRRIAYADFHLGYKKTALVPGELLLSIHLQKRFDKWFSYARKTGARNAQAISKICIAAAGKLHGDRVVSIHIGMGAVAPVPLRLRNVEQVLTGMLLTDATIAQARRALAGEITPIDDIRSSADYRRQVAANLLEDFLRGFAASAEASCS
jgi:CO/xanthine dehydrogenase FAD-binding subunit